MPVSADEFALMKDEPPIELVRGVVKVVPWTGGRQGAICARFGHALGKHVEEHDCGHVMSNDTYFLTGTDPDTVRGIDICYVSYVLIPKGCLTGSYLTVAPELAVEVMPAMGAREELLAKKQEYLECGGSVVVLIDPDRRTASLYRQDGSQLILTEADDLTIPDILPGFSVPVRRLFE